MRAHGLQMMGGNAETLTDAHGEQRIMRMTMFFLLVLILVLGFIPDGLADTVRCTTREDRAFNRTITTCDTDGEVQKRYDSHSTGA
jgi:preprotein translocase subunit SecG